MTLEEKMYYCLCINANQYRFNYGRNSTDKTPFLEVPSPDDIPGWVYTTSFTKYNDLDVPAITNQQCAINPIEWKQFRYKELFQIKKGKRLTKANMKSGSTPFIGAIDRNNGVSGYVGQDPIHEGETITVNYNGSVAEAFYQPLPFWACDDCNVLYPRFDINPWIALFLVTIIRKEKYRFNYGRKWHVERMKEAIIKLPVKKNGTPDWEFMENYIKSLKFSSQI